MTKKPGTKKWNRFEILDMIDRKFSISDMMRETGTTKSNIVQHCQRLVKEGRIYPNDLIDLESAYNAERKQAVNSKANEREKPVTEECQHNHDCCDCSAFDNVNGLCNGSTLESNHGTLSDLSTVNDSIVHMIEEGNVSERVHSKSLEERNLPVFIVDLEKELRNIDANLAYLKHELAMCDNLDSLERQTDVIKVYIRMRESIVKVKKFLKDEV